MNNRTFDCKQPIWNPPAYRFNILLYYIFKIFMCDRDELREINIKLDHIMFVQCEIFAMIKSNDIIDNKLDKCIQMLNKINSSNIPQNFTKKNDTPISIHKSSSNLEKKDNDKLPIKLSLQDQLIKEFKEKKFKLKPINT